MRKVSMEISHTYPYYPISILLGEMGIDLNRIFDKSTVILKESNIFFPI